MADAVILETTFLVDLERESRAANPGAAHAFLDGQGDRPVHITAVTAGELACGCRAGEQDRWTRLVERFTVLGVDRRVCWIYGQTFRYLRDNGLLIGSNDLWIAATAIANELPLVTRDPGHFRRVPGLEVLGY